MAPVIAIVDLDTGISFALISLITRSVSGAFITFDLGICNENSAAQKAGANEFTIKLTLCLSV
jgi:hypothetical protein